MGRAFEFRKARKMKRWSAMAKTFTRIGKDIVIAVKEGGPNPETNARLRAVIQNAKAGMIGINVGVPVPREPFSFGGINASKFGHGDITGVHSLNFWTNIKKITTKWEKQNDQTWMS